MSKKYVNINDFNLFIEVMRSTAKLVDSAKLVITNTGLEIYGAHAAIARCEITSNSVYADEQIEFAIDNLATFNKLLSTVKDVHDNDYSGLKFFYDQPFIKFESKKFKVKYHSINEDKISNWISKKVEVEMQSVFDFTTTNDIVKKILSHSYLFTDSKTVKVYLETQDGMDQNAIFATIGNRQIESGNEIVLKAGVVTFGKIPENRFITVDLERLSLLNAIQSQEINLSLMNYNVLVSNATIHGKNNTYFNLKTYLSLTK